MYTKVSSIKPGLPGQMDVTITVLAKTDRLDSIGVITCEWAISVHYENAPMQHTAIFHGCKNDNFQSNILTIFIFLVKTYIVGTR